MGRTKLGCCALDESEDELSVFEHRPPPGFRFTGIASMETTDADKRRAYLGIGERGENNLGYTWRIFEIDVALGINSVGWQLIVTNIPDVHDGEVSGLVVRANVLLMRCPGSEVNQPYAKVWLVNLTSKRVFKLEYSKEVHHELSGLYVGNSHVITALCFFTPIRKERLEAFPLPTDSQTELVIKASHRSEYMQDISFAVYTTPRQIIY